MTSAKLQTVALRCLFVFGLVLILCVAFVVPPHVRHATAASDKSQVHPLGAPPANDVCAGAEVIPGNGPFPLLTAVTPDITDATTFGDPPPPSCQTNVSRSIWYTFTPSVTAAYDVSTCASDGTASTVDDTVIAIYTSTGGCAGAFTQVSSACDDDGCVAEDFQSVISKIKLNSGTTYYILVWQFNVAPPTPGNTAVQLQVDRTPLPANDTCGGAIALTLNAPTVGTTVATVND